jgi:hypothetical protein
MDEQRGTSLICWWWLVGRFVEDGWNDGQQVTGARCCRGCVKIQVPLADAKRSLQHEAALAPIILLLCAAGPAHTRGEG